MASRLDGLVVRLLRSPLHPLLSRRALALRFQGRRTGKTYRVPVLHRRAPDGALEVVTSAERVWWRNLEGGAPAAVLLRGCEIEARVEVIRGPSPEVERALASSGVARRALRRFLKPLPPDGAVLLRIRPEEQRGDC